MSRVHRLFLLLGSTLALVVVLFGIPVTLIYLVGWPFPSPLPTRTELADMAAGRTPIPVDYLIDLLGLIMWILWVQIAWATAIETVAAFRGGLAKRARLLPGVQAGVARLVTGAVFLATSLAVRPVSAGPLVPVAVGLVDENPMLNNFGAATDSSGVINHGASGDQRQGTAPVANRTAEANQVTAYLTETGDTWWGIATDKLGSGTRWKELRAINLGRTMDDGTVISSSTDLLRPNWRLLMPAPRQITVAGDGIRTVTVERGDTIWGIAEDDLDRPSVAAVAEHVADITTMNASQLDGNPDLIHPGQKLDLPPLADRETTVQPDDHPDTATTPEEVSAFGDPGPRLPSPVEINVLPEPELDLEPAGRSSEAPTLDVDDRAAADDSTGSIGRPTDRTEPDAGREPESAAPVNPPVETTPGSTAGDEAAAEDAADEPATDDETALADIARDGAEPEGSGLEQPGAGTGSATEGTGSGEPAVPVLDLETAGTFPSTMPQLDAGPVPLRDPDGSIEDIGPQPATTPAPDEELTDTEVAAAGRPGDEGALDTDDSRAPVFVGLAALTLLGGYLYRSRGRRRDTSLRHRHPGRRPQPPKRRTRSLARRLSAAAQPEHPEFVNVGLRALGRQLQGTSRKQLPKITGVWVSHNRLVIALADDSPHGVPPPPFREFADGSGWSLRRSDFEEAREIAAGTNGPLPLLTTLGTTSALDLALTTNSRAPADAYGLSSALLYAVDLEVGRVISVQAGDESSTIEALTLMALELATSETADQVEIVLVGFGHRLATFDRVTVVDEVAEILDDVETISSRAVYASGDASPFATRVGNGAADTWDPVVVFHADRTDPDSQILVELAARTEGGVTAVCGYQTDTGWTMLVDGEKVRCPDLPGDLAHHEFIRPKLDGADLVADLFDEPWTDVELDEEFWAPMDDSTPDHTWYLADDTDEPSWRPMGSVTDSDRRGGTDLVTPGAVGTDQGGGALSTVDRWDLPPAPPSPTPIGPPTAEDAPDPDAPPPPPSPTIPPPPSPSPSTPPPLTPTLLSEGDRDRDQDAARDTDRAADRPTDRAAGRDGSGEDGDHDIQGDEERFEPAPLRLVRDDEGQPDPERESWPGGEAPVLKELRHSVELGPPPDAVGVAGGEAADDRQSGDPDDDDSSAAGERLEEPELTLVRNEPDAEEPVAEDSPVDTVADATTTEPAPNTTTDPTAEPAPDPTTETEPDGSAEAAAEVPLLRPPAVAKAVDDHDRYRDRGGDGAADGGQTGLRISVLGDFTINGRHIGDRSKPWKYTKTPELILYLLLHPGGASQDLLMEQLFPEQPPNRPRLNQLVSDARTKALGQNEDGDYHLPHASPTEPFYKLLPTISLDLRDFARHCARARAANQEADVTREMAEWRAALTLVTGRPFTLPHDGYEWALPEIEATIVKVEEAAMALADLAIDVGDHELAVWATKQGLLTGTGYYELLIKRGRAALLLQDPEEIVRAFADLQVSLDYTGAPEEHTPDLSVHPELEEIYNELSSEGRGQDRT
ncbi:MAG: LysM peptidoglycan-binding domain-containing protein [Actinomycetota bacterium]